MARSLLLLFLLSIATACAHGAGASARDHETPPAAAPAPAEGQSTSPPAIEQAPAPVAPPRAETAAPEPGAPVPRIAHPGPAPQDPERERLIRAARRYLGRRFAGDCSRFVLRVFAEARVPLPALRPERTMSESLYRALSPVSRPLPGDLAFFHETRRPDRSGRTPRRFTHVALVERVDGARVTLIHRESRGIRRLAMNIERPHDKRENGMVRSRRARDRPGTRYLAGELFAGYASALQGDAVASAELVLNVLE